ncbi:MAG: hypothetical protein Q9195_001472 [Heterodermia aff. obscurata]
MSFRKRNLGLSSQNPPTSTSSPQPQPPHPGTRPSPIDGRPTTSTGTPTLDALFGGHGGLLLGNSLLIEESGTTDFAGTLLRFYAAEGVVQGQQVHVVGVPEGWGRELPGLVEGKDEGRGTDRPEGEAEQEKMKIAWRYERMGQFGEERQTGSRNPRAPTPNRTPFSLPSSPSDAAAQNHQPFCHTFDLTKRLIPPSSSVPIIYHPVSPTDLNLLTPLLSSLSNSLTASSPSLPHRVLIPNLLSPLLYPFTTAHPHILLPFLHSLRALLRKHPLQLTIMITLPLTLYPRHTGLVRWTELLIDGVIELTPFPHDHYLAVSDTAKTAKGKEDEKPQGLLKVLRVPVLSEKGQGLGASGVGGEDMAFWVSRRRFVIKPFSLPPVEGDQEAQGDATKVEIDF